MNGNHQRGCTDGDEMSGRYLETYCNPYFLQVFVLSSISDRQHSTLKLCKKSLQGCLEAVGHNSSWGPVEMIKCLDQIMESFRVENNLKVI